MYTEYNYMNMSTIEKLLLNHTLILVCILNIITYIYIYISTIEILKTISIIEIKLYLINETISI